MEATLLDVNQTIGQYADVVVVAIYVRIYYEIVLEG
jgi:hypothetical protein